MSGERRTRWAMIVTGFVLWLIGIAMGSLARNPALVTTR